MRDYYAVLELPYSVTPEQLRTRYKQLIRIYHPDRFPGHTDKTYAEERLKIINEAYAALGKIIKPGAPPEWDLFTPPAETQTQPAPTNVPVTVPHAVVAHSLLRQRIEQALVVGGIVLAGLVATPLVVSTPASFDQWWGITRRLAEPTLPVPSQRPPLSSLAPADWVPITSPSGYRMVFVLRQEGIEKLYVRDANSGQLRPVLDEAIQSHSLVWSPDENKLAFVVGAQGKSQVYILDLQTTQIQQSAALAETSQLITLGWLTRSESVQ